MTDESPTPIADLVDELLSQNVPGQAIVVAARRLERSLAAATSRRVSLEATRQYERDRKAAYRERKARGHVPGTNGGDISSITESKSQKESKKDTSPVPDVPDNEGQLPLDVWPKDYVAQFWNAYPKQRRTEHAKVEKKLARLRATGSVTWKELMDGLARYRRSSDVARGFAKGPMVWLNGGCWKDEIETRGEDQGGNIGQGSQPSFGFAAFSASLRARGAGGQG